MVGPVRGGSDEGGANDVAIWNFLLRVKMAAFGLRFAMGSALLLVGLVFGAAAAADDVKVQDALEAVAMPPLLGGLYDVRVDSPKVVKATRVAVKAFNRGSNDVHRSAVSNVISAQAQVVAGIMYHLTLELRTTVCRKISVSRNCRFNKDPQYAKTMTCRFKVLDRPWVGPMQVFEQRCSRTAK
ncbi:cystatin-2-like [Mobula hypostoma]|uniref:cystatin-2-like n=1 Tax=Mobula hypostoma TaxID=723540 RepID=UPI002FC3A9A5